MEAIGFVKALIIIQGLYRIVENCGTEDVADFLEINKWLNSEKIHSKEYLPK